MSSFVDFLSPPLFQCVFEDDAWCIANSISTVCGVVLVGLGLILGRVVGQLCGGVVMLHNLELSVLSGWLKRKEGRKHLVAFLFIRRLIG